MRAAGNVVLAALVAAGATGCGNGSSQGARPPSARHKALLAQMCSELARDDDPASKRRWCLKQYADLSDAELRSILKFARETPAPRRDP